MADLHYTLVAVPYRTTADEQRTAQFTLLQSALGTQLGPVARQFIVPNLKVGTLDSLLEASDELQKLDPQLEGVCFKLAGILEDVAGAARSNVTMLRINPQSNDVSCDYYLKDYSWNSSAYNPKESIGELLQKFALVVSGAEERTRTSLSEYSELKGRLVNASRRSQGNLVTRPIGEMVKSWCASLKVASPVESDFLTTIFVAVPNSQQDEWCKVYPTLHQFVVPGSSSVVATDSEFTLNSLVIFKKNAEEVKMSCRKLKYFVRELANADDLTNTEVADLEKKAASDKTKLTLLLSQQFTQCFVAWIHCKAVRLFVEGVLRFGFPPKFVPVLVAADAKKDEEIRTKLSALYADYANKFQKADDTMVDSGALQHEFPFVSLKVANVLRAR